MQTFYLITLDSCGHCHDFLNDIWPQLVYYITNNGYEIQHHDVQYSKQRQWYNNNPRISSYVDWYPTLLINNGNGIVRYEGHMDDIRSIESWIQTNNI